MSEKTGFAISLEHVQDGDPVVRVEWEEVPDTAFDGPAPRFERPTPYAPLILATALGNCLVVSLLSCLHELQVEPRGLRTTVRGAIAFNERGRAQISRMEVRIHLEGHEDLASRLEHCLRFDEDYSLITESVRSGIPISVHLVDTIGRRTSGRDPVNEPATPQWFN
jgi:hypothetical protein